MFGTITHQPDREVTLLGLTTRSSLAMVQNPFHCVFKLTFNDLGAEVVARTQQPSALLRSVEACNMGCHIRRSATAKHSILDPCISILVRAAATNA